MSDDDGGGEGLPGLAALIAAYQMAEDNAGLRATLPLAGHALIEHQVRQATRAGANHVVILVERVPAALTAAIDRLRRGGIAVEVARSVSDAADRIHPDEKLLFIADGLIADQALIDRLVAARPPAMMTVPDDPGHAMFERIDAADRWAGLMLVNGARLRSTAAMLGDWDLQSTLLRRTVQEHPIRIDATGGLSIVSGVADVTAVRDRLLLDTRGREGSWLDRWVYPPIEDRLAPPLIRAETDPVWLRGGAIALALAAAAMFLAGWLWPGLVLLLIAGPVDAVAVRLARMRLQSFRPDKPAALMRQGSSAAALLALAWRVSLTGGWGCWLLAFATLAFLVAQGVEERMLARLAGKSTGLPVWRADGDALAWTLLIVTVALGWTIGLAATALHALASFFAVQRRLSAAIR